MEEPLSFSDINNDIKLQMRKNLGILRSISRRSSSADMDPKQIDRWALKMQIRKANRT